MALEELKVKGEDAVLVGHQALKVLVARIFERLGVAPEDARIAADVLVLADLRGVESHGVQNYMKMIYVPGLTEGTINPRPNVRVVRETPATALVDGDRGLGHVVAYRAMELAIRKAGEVGVGFVTVTNSTHFGMAGYYAMMALQHDMVGIAMTNAPPRVLPTFGREVMLGTNPIAVAAPCGRERPFVFDAATSTVAAGKVYVAQRLGVPIPLGWATDEAGNPTGDAAEAARHLKLLPLGGTREQGSHKGYALALVVDILCGVLSGAGFSAALQRPVAGHFFGALDVAAFRPVEEFKAMMDAMVRALHDTPPAPGHAGVLVPGDPEEETMAHRLREGIPLHRPVVEYLRSLARELGVEATV